MPDETSAPLYSIVIPTFARPDALRACLAAIERLRWQGRQPEVVVVDDGSDPPCRSIVESFAPRLCVVYEHRPNGGVAVARNRGLALARGDFVGFVADNQRLPVDYLDVVDRFFREHPAADVVSLNLTTSGPSLLRAVQSLYLQLALGQSYRRGDARDGSVPSTTLAASRAAMFRRALFDRIGGFDESLRVGEDGEMGQRLAARGIPVHILVDHFVDHQEDRTALDYLRQRLRYGRSFARVLDGGDARPTLERLALLGAPICAGRKLRSWIPVARDQGASGRFLLLSPLLFGFLCFFYLGCWLELRARRER